MQYLPKISYVLSRSFCIEGFGGQRGRVSSRLTQL